MLSFGEKNKRKAKNSKQQLRGAISLPVFSVSFLIYAKKKVMARITHTYLIWWCHHFCTATTYTTGSLVTGNAIWHSACVRCV